MLSVEGSAGVLLERSWAPVSVGGTQLLTKAHFGDTAYHLLLSDTRHVWEEEVDAATIGDRAQELNRRLRAPVSAFFSHLCEAAQPCLSGTGGPETEREGGSPTFSLLRFEPEWLTVHLKSELAGVPFYWEFRCTPASVAVVCSHLVRPLLAVSRVLQRQVDELKALLVRKDAEIQDYTESGAVLSRGRLQTEVFEEERYKHSFTTKTLPQVCASQASLGFDVNLQELYAAVMGQRPGRTRSGYEGSADRSVPTPRVTPHGPEPAISPPVAGEKDCAPDPREKGPAGLEDGVGLAPAEGPSAEQTLPLSQTPSERPPARPRKRKARGLFS